MTDKIKKVLILLIGIALFLGFGAVLLMYVKPMTDITLNLSMVPYDGEAIIDPGEYDDKGWTVFVQNETAVTELSANGLGGYTGLELGQTFYYSRVMNEDLDDPQIQISAGECSFSVWLDDVLIYTDCPDLDNRIGYLQLPMNGRYRSNSLTISLPQDYQGKTLTIAQSFPEYSETPTVRARPADVALYCGYAYESELISESFATAMLAALCFLLGTVLLAAFIRNQDWGVLSLSLLVFSWMLSELTGASFFQRYYGTHDNSPLAVLPLITSGTLLCFLASRAGKHRKILWGTIAVYVLSTTVSAAWLAIFPHYAPADLAAAFVRITPYWIAFAGLVVVLLLGALFWRRENWFYRVFTPIALWGIPVYWAVLALFAERDMIGDQLKVSLLHCDISYIYHRTFLPFAAAALFTAIAETVKTEINRRTEKQLLEQRQKMAQENYENMRCQHEEIMMIRHDMVRHLLNMQAMDSEEQIRKYLDDLLGQNRSIRPVVQTGNEMLDIILGSKLNAARDAGITVEIKKAEAPAVLPLRDPDLCSLVMNVMDNAIAGASGSGAENPHLLLDIHVKNDHLAIVCENSVGICPITKEHEKETLQKHGLGLKIMENIAERYQGHFEASYSKDRYLVQVAIPLHQSENSRQAGFQKTR